jgi:glycosyltransferase involved in cell wall biosynthesis
MHKLSSLEPSVGQGLPGPGDKIPSRTRIAVVTSHPIQYATPLYAYLNRDPELDVTALFCSDFSLRGAKDKGFGQSVKWDVDLLDGYNVVFLGDRAKTRTLAGFWSLICPELIREIRKSQYDVVLVHGQQYAAYVLAFALAKLQGIPVMTRGETHLGLDITPVRAQVRKRLLGLQYRSIDRFLAIGSANAEYYRALGVADERIFQVPYSVDNERFMKASSLSPEERAAYRERLGVRDARPILLYASKLMRRKHPDDLLRAAGILANKKLEHHVVVAGSGEMEAELRSLATELGVHNVTFTGFLNQSELPRLYGASDVFVLPSEDEPWGLIVNEVMCAGLPVVVGAGVGCVPDLVKVGVNGATCAAGNAASLAAALEPLIIDPELRSRMGAESRRIIADWGYEQCRQGIRAAVAGLPRASR